MQALVRLVKSDAPNDAPKDIELHYPLSITYSAFVMWLRTDYKVLPSAGGSMDQDMFLMEDFTTLLGEYNRLKRIYESETS